MEKKEITSIRIMKYLCFIFGVTTIGFICLNNYRLIENISQPSNRESKNINISNRGSKNVFINQ